MIVWVQLGHFISSVTTFICGVVIAIISCWEVSLLTLLVAPLVLAIGASYNKRMTVISSLKMDCQSQATSLVEQVKIPNKYEKKNVISINFRKVLLISEF